MNLSKRYEQVKEDIADHCRELGRDPQEVVLIAVSKTVGIDTIENALAAGIHEFGENRPDSLSEKQKRFPDARWHFIGNVQSRKIPEIVASADLIHSVYKFTHLPLINASAEKQGKVQNILIEVNVSGEASKGGLSAHELESFLEACSSYQYVKVCGLMTMAPQGDLGEARMCFDALYRLQHEMKSHFSGSMVGQELRELSMGMSEDWREAIAAGATMVRIGRAIFNDDFMR